MNNLSVYCLSLLKYYRLKIVSKNLTHCPMPRRTKSAEDLSPKTAKLLVHSAMLFLFCIHHLSKKKKIINNTNVPILFPHTELYAYR